MIDVHVIAGPSTGGTVVVDVVVLDDGPNGIARVDVRDRHDVPVHSFDGACQHELTLHLAEVPTSRLPLTVLARECVTNAVVRSGPWLDPELPGLGGDNPALCSALVSVPPSAACGTAIQAASAARRAFATDCTSYLRWIAARDGAIAAAGVAWAAAVGLGAAAIAAFAAPPFGWIAGIFLAIAAAVAAIIASYFTGLAIGYGMNADRDFAALTNDRTAFDTAAITVGSACCPEHRIVDLTPLTCS